MAAVPPTAFQLNSVVRVQVRARCSPSSSRRGALVGSASAQAPVVSAVKMCNGDPVTYSDSQVIAFGCVDNEVVQCGYNANTNPNDYQGALWAFINCR